jgi:UDP-3-O-[3-hydroxymyristoyl] glucosamine N-acyltransferase
MFLRLKEMGYHIETYIHPDARIYTEHPIGDGCVILPSAVIEPHVRLGANTMVWCNVTLAHHSYVADHCWVASGAVISGHAGIQRNSFIGVNATIVNEVVISEYNIIGGGALITKTTRPSTVHLARSGEEVRFSSHDYAKYFGV